MTFYVFYGLIVGNPGGVTGDCYWVLVELPDGTFEKKLGCFASNRYFGEFFKMSKSRCSQIITKLQDKGFIAIEYNMTPGTKEISQRILKINWRKIRKS